MIYLQSKSVHKKSQAALQNTRQIRSPHTVSDESQKVGDKTGKGAKITKQREPEGKQNWPEHRITYTKQMPESYSQRNADNLKKTHLGEKGLRGGDNEVQRNAINNHTKGANRPK